MGYEATGLAILKSLGFENIMSPQHQTEYSSYDFDAEKDGIKYSIEIKTTSEKTGNYTIPILQLREMTSQLIDNKRKALLLLVDESQDPINYYLFELKRGLFGLIPTDFDEEGKSIED